MSLKRLLNKEGTVKIQLNLNSGIFLFIYDDLNSDCILVEGFDGDYSFFTKVSKLKEIRFVGSKEIFESVAEKNYNWFQLIERKVFIEAETEAHYFPENAKVRFLSKSNSLINNASVRVGSKKKKVLIVDDSKTIQKLISKVVESSDYLEVLGYAECPSQARKIIETQAPDLITLDIHMPEMSGVDFLKSYLKDLKIPVVMISSVSIDEGPLVMEALSNGALTYIQKPSISEVQNISADIKEKLEAVANSHSVIIHSKKASQAFSGSNGLIAIGSSTGGTQALQSIFCALPKKIPPILVVQHIPAVFSKALADRLDKLCPFKVKEAEDSEKILENTVYIAPGGKQMKVTKKGTNQKVVNLRDDAEVNGFRPSVDYMFRSLAKFPADDVLAVLLTGMGKDGARGLLDLKNQQAKTIAQDEASSVVFGMPKEAIKIGAAQSVVSLDNMAKEIVNTFNRMNKKQKAA